MHHRNLNRFIIHKRRIDYSYTRTSLQKKRVDIAPMATPNDLKRTKKKERGKETISFNTRFLCNKSLKCALTSLCKIRCLNRAMAASRFRRVTSSLNRYYSNRPTFVHSNQSDEIIRDCYSGDFITTNTKCSSKRYTHYDDIINFFFSFYCYLYNHFFFHSSRFIISND